MGKKLDDQLAFEPDIAVVRECEQSLQIPGGYHFVWTGNNPRKSLGVLSKSLPLEIRSLAIDRPAYFLPSSPDGYGLSLQTTRTSNNGARQEKTEHRGNLIEFIASLSRWIETGTELFADDYNNSVIRNTAGLWTDSGHQH